MNRVYLSIGSNIDREHWICQCLDMLSTHFASLDLSPVYESAASGFVGDPFYNLVVGLNTEMLPEELSLILRRIEDACGRERIRGEKFSSRTMDIDLLCYGDLCAKVAGCQLPRADILQYDFVLRPLAELSPEGLHPQLARSWAELWTEYSAAPDFVHSDLQRVDFRYPRSDSARRQL